jgi:two-component system chemotaxis response regulator CheY
MTESPPPNPAPTTPSPADPCCRPVRILYADDLRELRVLMQLMLTRDGHTVELFPDAGLALPRVEAAPGDFDLVITDHHMPIMNGLEFVARLRQSPYAGKVVVFSSELAPEVRAAYLALHVDHVLPKPVAPAELRRLLAGMFPAPTASA